MERTTKEFESGFGHQKCSDSCNICDGVLCPDALEIIQKAGFYENLIQQAKLVKIIRCKNCRYFEYKGTSKQGICKCEEKDTNFDSEFYPFENDFCSYAKEK